VVFAAAIAIGLVLPFLLPSVGLQGATDFRRTLTESSRYSADWKSYLASSAWAHRWLLPYLRTWNDVLFPGLLPLGFATVGTFATLGGRSAPDPGPAVTLGPRNGGRTTGPARPDAVGPRELGGYYVLLTALAFWVSLGPQAGLYTVLFHAIPVFSFLRAPARFGIVVVLGLAVLSAIGVAHATRRRRPAGVPRAELLCLLLVAELCVAPLALPDNSEPVNAAYRYLATQPRAPVVELPFFYRRIDYHRHAYYLLNSTRHWQPLVNGYSDYIPQDFRDHAVAISSFPNPESFALLRARGVRFVVFTLRFYNRDAKSAVLERIASYGQYLRPVTRDRDVLLYEIVEWPAP
jgi:hypothetical protein